MGVRLLSSLWNLFRNQLLRVVLILMSDFFR